MAKNLIGNLPKGLAFILSAPAGTGKTTLVQKLTKEFSCIKMSVSYTTREPRVGEVDGIDYHFVTPDDFMKKIIQGDFLEYAKVFDYYYGTSKSDLIKELENGFHVVLVIDTQGALNIKDSFKATSIFVIPPSFEELKRRLTHRSTESQESINQRLEWAKHEVEVAQFYDYQITNEELKTAYEALRSIIIAEEHKTINLKPVAKNG